MKCELKQQILLILYNTMICSDVITPFITWQDWEIMINIVYIQSDEARKNTNDLEYYYLILAERKDVDKLVIEE